MLWGDMGRGVGLDCSRVGPEVRAGSPVGNRLGYPNAGAHPTEVVLRRHLVYTECARRVFHLSGMVHRVWSVLSCSAPGDMHVYNGPVAEVEARAPL